MLGRNVHYVTATRPVDSRRCIDEHLRINASSRRGSMSAIHTLGWTLMHSLWQCALAAAGLAALLTVVPARASREAAARQSARAAGRVSVDTRARSHRLVAARDSHPGERADGQRPHAAAARRAAGPRAGSRAAARLPREPAAIDDRDAPLLP